MLVKTFSILKEEILKEASESADGQDYIVRSILEQTNPDEFLPTGFNDCWDLVKEQIKRKINGRNRQS